MKRSAKWAIGFILVLAVFLIGGYAAVRRVSERGDRFFRTGKSIVTTLDRASRALRSRDLQTLQQLYAPDFAGNSLGLISPEKVSTLDGIDHWRFSRSEASLDRAGAVAEWASYLDGFDSVEEVRMYVDRLNSWEPAGPWEATVRFELIGTLKGTSRSGIDRTTFEMEFQAGSEPLLRAARLVDGHRLQSELPQFENVAAAAGVAFRNRYYPPFLTEPLRFGMIRYGPGGIAAADYDSDGFYDLFVPDGVASRLFRNKGDGTFQDVTVGSGLEGLDGVSVGLFADYDNDGHKDFFVSRTFKPNQLFHNNGDGTFTDVTSRSGIGEDSCTTVASWADYDNDGFLDLYVGRYLDPRVDIPTTFYARNGLPNQLYHNNGDGTFTNVTEKAGVGELGLCLGTVWGDYDGDGYPDLLVVNDFGRSTLYHNNQNGTFTDVTVKAGALAYGAGMNASFADYDNDGRLDIYTTDIRSDHAWFAEEPTVSVYMLNCMRQGVWRSDMPLYWEIFRQSGFGFIQVFQEMAYGNHLLRNRGDGTFEDVSQKTSANPPGWFWGASFADFNNDGWQDIYAADGWVYNDRDTEIEMDFLHNVVNRQSDYKTGLFFDPKFFGKLSWHGWERNRMLRSNGDGTFLEVGRAANSDLVTNSRGVAVADFWNRGALDIAVSASDDDHALLKNQGRSTGNWVAFELQGVKSNRDAVGARVTVRSNGNSQIREVTLGDGYGSQNSLRVYFGLNQAASADEVIVRWPGSGSSQTFRAVAANRILALKEGDGEQLMEKHYTALKP